MACLKEQVAQKAGVPVTEQRLVCGGKQLEDRSELSERGVQRGSTIHLLLRLRGRTRIEELPEAGRPLVLAPVGRVVSRWSLNSSSSAPPPAKCLLPGWEPSERVPLSLTLCVFGQPLPELVGNVVAELEEQAVTSGADMSAPTRAPLKRVRFVHRPGLDDGAGVLSFLCSDVYAGAAGEDEEEGRSCRKWRRRFQNICTTGSTYGPPS